MAELWCHEEWRDGVLSWEEMRYEWCSEEEWEMLRRTFWEKERNLGLL